MRFKSNIISHKEFEKEEVPVREDQEEVTNNQDTLRGLVVVTCIRGNIDRAHSYYLSNIDPYSNHFNI